MGEGSPEELIDYYADRCGLGGTVSRLLNEGEEPTDLKIDKYEIIQHFPGKGGQVKESWTIDEEGVWHKDAKKS